ncbi:hypothetical protein [Streptomyces iconiensis]|uniref:Uncharacterized protein n=1 Tax=Streptomyces iconiensis TaxID=1384038 RepID=A0ABT7A9C9_9ACTN|nr:hypothetical protein [Streptomyces iconiensis]MDJ1137931.1 hypothetical protein [Streptomyces iconiensis]
MDITQLATLARAYVYSGDWVADCPRPGCANTEHVYGRLNRRDPRSPRVVQLPAFSCSYCHMDAIIDWPQHMTEIMAVLALRPVPSTRNWYPEQHETAVRFGIPHGQSAQQLRDENAAHDVEPGPTLQGVG